MTTQLSVILPAFNEADALEPTVQELQQVLALAFDATEIIVVDDGSSDLTAAKARELGCLVVRHAANLGYGKALKSGILAAQFDTVAILDADGTYPADALPEMFRLFNDGFDMVVARREGADAAETLGKPRLRWLLRTLVEFTAGQSIPDVNSGMRIFSRQAVTRHFSGLCDTYSFTTSLTLAYLLTKRSVGYLPITYRNRQGSSKVRLVRDSLRTLQYVVQSILRYNPIKLFLIVTALPALLCLTLAIAGSLLGSGTLLSLAIVCLLCAALILSCGFMAEQLRQILDALNENP